MCEIQRYLHDEKQPVITGKRGNQVAVRSKMLKVEGLKLVQQDWSITGLQFDYVDKKSTATKYSSYEDVRREVKKDGTTVVNNFTTEQDCYYPVHNKSIVAFMRSAEL